MNDIEVFSNPTFGAIRAVEIDNEPWFCLNDVCKPLGIRPRDCKQRLKQDGCDTIAVIDSLGRTQQATFISEGNLYRAIFQSKKPEAEAFTDWVTEEVLPTLRRNGTYTIPHRAPDVSLSGLANLIRVTRQTMLDMGGTPQDVGQMVKGMFETWNVPVPAFFGKEPPRQIGLFGEQTRLIES